MTTGDDLINLRPDIEVPAREFGVNSDMLVPAFSRHSEYVPDRDESYRFDPDTTLAILAGFRHNRRVMVQGYHGTGKSTHVEQVAARLNWPLIRINLDGHVSRIDLVGRDAIVVKDGNQVTEFREGLLPWALQRPIALVFDEYDAGRPDVMFVIQRVLEASGKLTLLDQRRGEVLRHAGQDIAAQRLAAHVLDCVENLTRPAACGAKPRVQHRIVVGAAQRQVIGMTAHACGVGVGERPLDHRQTHGVGRLSRQRRPEAHVEVLRTRQRPSGLQQCALATLRRSGRRLAWPVAHTTFTRVIASGNSAANARW